MAWSCRKTYLDSQVDSINLQNYSIIPIFSKETTKNYY